MRTQIKSSKAEELEMFNEESKYGNRGEFEDFKRRHPESTITYLDWRKYLNDYDDDIEYEYEDENGRMYTWDMLKKDIDDWVKNGDFEDYVDDALPDYIEPDGTPKYEKIYDDFWDIGSNGVMEYIGSSRRNNMKKTIKSDIDWESAKHAFDDKKYLIYKTGIDDEWEEFPFYGTDNAEYNRARKSEQMIDNSRKITSAKYDSDTSNLRAMKIPEDLPMWIFEKYVDETKQHNKEWVWYYFLEAIKHNPWKSGFTGDSLYATDGNIDIVVGPQQARCRVYKVTPKSQSMTELPYAAGGKKDDFYDWYIDKRYIDTFIKDVLHNYIWSRIKSSRKSIKSSKWVEDVADKKGITFEQVLEVFKDNGYGEDEADDFWNSKWNDVSDAFGEDGISGLDELFGIEIETEDDDIREDDKHVDYDKYHLDRGEVKTEELRKELMNEGYSKEEIDYVFDNNKLFNIQYLDKYWQDRLRRELEFRKGKSVTSARKSIKSSSMIYKENEMPSVMKDRIYWEIYYYNEGDDKELGTQNRYDSVRGMSFTQAKRRAKQLMKDYNCDTACMQTTGGNGVIIKNDSIGDKKMKIQSKRLIKSGPGAGYDVTVRGIELDNSNWKMLSDDYDERYDSHTVQVEIPVKPCFAEYWSAEAYYEGIDSTHDVYDPKIDSQIDGGIAILQVEIYPPQWIKGDIMTSEELNEAIIDLLPSELNLTMMYGGGWLHSYLPEEGITFDDDNGKINIDEGDTYDYNTVRCELKCPYIVQNINAFFRNPDAYYDEDGMPQYPGDDIESSRKPIKSSMYDVIIKDLDTKEILVDDGPWYTYDDANDFGKQKVKEFESEGRNVIKEIKGYHYVNVHSSRKPVTSGLTFRQAVQDFKAAGQWNDYYEMQQDWESYKDGLERDGLISEKTRSTWGNPCTPETFKRWNK